MSKERPPATSPQESPRLREAIERFTAAHREDPVTDSNGEPSALAYHQRLSHWVMQLDPGATDPLRLAAWCQHIRRWTIARGDFPEGVTGYKKWRSTLAQFHATQAAEILGELDYDDATIRRVRELLIKKGLKKDPEVQLFEDAICLTFIEQQLTDFARKHDEPKLVDILRKTWRKMSADGHKAAAILVPQLPADTRKLLQKALGS